MINLIMIVVALIIVLVLGYNALLKAKRSGSNMYSTGGMTMLMLLDTVKEEIAEIVKDDSFSGSTEAEFRNALNRKAKIVAALKESSDGKDNAKDIVIDIIYNIVIRLCPSTQEILNVIPFNSPGDLTPHVKFEIMMYNYKQVLIKENQLKDAEHRERNPEKDAFKVWVTKYGLHEAKNIIEDGSRASYAITEEEVHDTYDKEGIKLTYVDMAKIVSILLFQRYKGFGCIDTVRALDINGINIGVSGSILTYLRTQEFVATQSVWANYKGRYIHLRFLDFGSVEEIRRIVQLLARYNSPGPLTERRGYIVNNMYDESRILAVRPPFAEYWAAFIRKFGADHKTLRFLIYKDYIQDWELPFEFIKLLMQGGVTSAFTGRQGCGKTTMMTAAIEFMDPRHNLRVIEMAFEMNAREHYPERNIMTWQETEFLPPRHAQDAQKKSDGAIALFGEVATDEVALRMIQAGKVASLYTIFSHHGKTAEDTVYALADSCMAASGSASRTSHEKSVIDVLRIDVHLDYTADGKYYVERITEIIKLPEGVPYPEIDPNNLEYSRAVIDREYYTRLTDRKTFTVQDIIRYDLDTDRYYVVAPPSNSLIQGMMSFMDKSKKTAFNDFMMKRFNIDINNLNTAAPTQPKTTNKPRTVASNITENSKAIVNNKTEPAKAQTNGGEGAVKAKALNRSSLINGAKAPAIAEKPQPAATTAPTPKRMSKTGFSRDALVNKGGVN